MSLKDVMAADISAVFLNPNEFAETHSIDGESILAIVDEEKAVPNPTDGVYVQHRKLFVKKEELGYQPLPDQRMNVDGQDFYVVDCVGDDLLEVLLEAHRS